MILAEGTQVKAPKQRPFVFLPVTDYNATVSFWGGGSMSLLHENRRSIEGLLETLCGDPIYKIMARLYFDLAILAHKLGVPLDQIDLRPRA